MFGVWGVLGFVRRLRVFWVLGFAVFGFRGLHFGIWGWILGLEFWALGFGFVLGLELRV